MKKLLVLMIVSGLVVLMMAPSWAQQGMPGPGKGGMGQDEGMGRGMGMQYNPQTVETVMGEVVAVHQATGRRTRQGVHITLKTDKETIPVSLGPAFYLETEKFQINKGDKLQVKGSRVNQAMVAGEVKKGDQVLKLRDDQGRPLWSRGSQNLRYKEFKGKMTKPSE
jgi:hypothetical protein